MSSHSAKSWGREAAVIIVLGAVTVAAFRGVGKCVFVNLDDDLYVAQNAHVRLGLVLLLPAGRLSQGDAEEVRDHDARLVFGDDAGGAPVVIHSGGSKAEVKGAATQVQPLREAWIHCESLRRLVHGLEGIAATGCRQRTISLRRSCSATSVMTIA
jgi:hypothetical protein